MSFTFSVKKYNNIAELSSHLEEIKVEIGCRIDSLSVIPTIFEDQVIRLYVEIRSTDKVAKHFKTLGFKSLRGTVFASSDVSEIINTGRSCMNIKLLQMAREIFNKNADSAMRAYN